MALEQTAKYLVKYTIKLTAYEMAMLDAACRASGLPLVKALIKAADNITMGHEAREDAPEFKVEQSKSQIVSSPDGVPLPDMSETHVSLRLDKAQKEEE